MTTVVLTMLPRLYQLLWKLARPLLRRHHRLGQGFHRRLAPGDWPEGRGSEPCRLWLHGASGGEAYLIRELVRELASLRPGLRLLCTSLTSQGLEILRSMARDFQHAGVAIHTDYLPLDDPGLMRRAIRQVFGPPSRNTPAVLALMETELWPGLLLAAREYGLSTLILNGRLREQSLRAYRPFRAFLRRVAPARILAVSPEDQDRFRLLFGTGLSSSLMPNIKFDRIASPRLSGPSRNNLVVLASVRREEEALLAPCLAGLLRKAPHCGLVLAPRHLHRLEAWEKRLRLLGLPYTRVSRLPEPVPPGRILLWDSFGAMDQLYSEARAVFVGGSLAPLGGQNFLEPLGWGVAPCIGPFWSNFAWVGREIVERGLVRQVGEAGELVPALLEQLEQAPEREAVRERLALYLAPRRGGARLAAEAVAECLTEEGVRSCTS